MLPVFYMAALRLLPSVLILVVVPLSAAGRALGEGLTPYQAKSQGVGNCCPKSPFQYCDFFFDGYDHIVPTFHLADGFNGDHVLSPILAKSFHWSGSLFNFAPGVKNVQTQQLVNVVDTYQNGTYLTCNKLPPMVTAGNQFYLNSGGSNVGKLWVRTFNRKTQGKRGQHGRRWYARDRCVLLPITDLTIPNTSGELTKLFVNDGNQIYPQRRRCVVFRTSM